MGLCDSLRQQVDALAGLHQDPAGEAFAFEAWADLKNATQEQEEYVVDQLLPKNWLSLLLGDPKVGKSQLVGTLVQAVALGGRCLDRDTQPGPVLLLALEEARFAVKRRFEKMGLSSDAPVHIVFKRPPRDPLGWLKRQIKQYQPALVVIDTLVRLIDFREINDYAKTAQDMAPLLAIARESGAHMMALHHTRKSGGEHGAEAMASQAIYATADMKLNITREGGQRRYLTSDGRDHGRIQEPLLLHMDEITGPGGSRRRHRPKQYDVVKQAPHDGGPHGPLSWGATLAATGSSLWGSWTSRPGAATHYGRHPDEYGKAERARAMLAKLQGHEHFVVERIEE